MNLAIFDNTGNSVGEYNLKEELLEREKGNQAVQDAVVSYLAGRRNGTASTKNRANVRGGKSKPWRQKGTGRARAGNVRSPLWRGGGIIFGPSPRNYSKKLNTKVRKLAIRRALTSRIDEEDVLVIEEINFDTPKTKQVVSFLTAIGSGENALIVLGEVNENVAMASRNLPSVTHVLAKNVNCYHLLLHRKIIITKQALEFLENKLVP